MVTRTLLRSAAESIRSYDPASKSICPSNFSTRVRTCLRSLRNSSISSRSFFMSDRADPAACRAASRSVTAASRSARRAPTRSSVRRMRSSSPARESSSRREPADIGVAMLCALERRFGLVHQRTKRRRILHRQVGENFAIQFNTGLFETVDESAVGNFGLTASRTNADNPKRAEIALLQAASNIAVPQRLLHGFLGGAMQLALSEKEAL